MRDKKNTTWLRRNGWTVIRIWEHNIKKDIEVELDMIMKELEKKQKK